jgi:hypothetical protein
MSVVLQLPFPGDIFNPLVQRRRLNRIYICIKNLNIYNKCLPALRTKW